ncbi:hypothetical protein B0T21DRAFT_288533 [Apiosordaria backusii]|uniref:Polyketide synthase n=1 Tax=Apiosordaria backusii TaxID=314023 RepID=A0AA40BL64_9PEZI|nr:hypothetical protein B0T21DRAFT_288533 [Apiosordaria backusii]
MPASRFEQQAFCTPGLDKPGCFKVQGAHFLPEDIYQFDAAFFNMRAEEAKNSDPQHRMMLECALEAAENAGQSLLDIAGKNIGVFVACGSQEYAHRVAEDLAKTTAWTATGIAACMFANRLSYFFDVHGPSVAIEAACASSCYATHQACQALRNGECEAAFVGASAICFGPNLWITLEKMGALSAEGKSFSYDHKAAGFGRGEGGACLLIKRLDDAVRDGDPIHAVIRGSACNHCGRSEGITMPSRISQERLLVKVHEAAGLSPSETPVVEGHGTGTPAGDPIEAGAFAAILAKDRTEANPLYIGSIKSNFGHLEGASGILGMVKAILMVKHGIILPTAGFEEMNKRIEGKEKMRVVGDKPIAWPENELRRALVTNFGFGGSNSAVLLEQPPVSPALTGRLALEAYTNGHGLNGTNGHAANGVNGHTNGTNGVNGHHVNGNGVNGHSTNGTNDVNGHHRQEPNRLFVLSAKTDKSLSAYLSSFVEFLEDENPTPDWSTVTVDDPKFTKNLSYTLGQRRTHHPYRVAVVANSVDALKEKLASKKPTRAKQDRVVAFCFTGQGAQYAQMASGLRHYKVFADALDQAEDLLTSMGASWSLTEELNKDASVSRVDDAEISQPACTAVQLALVELFKSWGITPRAVIGHSSGEMAAAYTAGLISFTAAVATAYFRGQAASQLAAKGGVGAMLALGVGFEEASKLIVDHGGDAYATVGAINSPNSVTVSGDTAAIEAIHKAADEQGLFVRRLKVSLAYHSRHMEEVAEWYRAAIQPYYDEEFVVVESDDAKPTFVSSVTGQAETSIDSSYWVKNLVRPVRFSDAITKLFSQQQDIKIGQTPNVIVEIGPHAALKNPIKRTVEDLSLKSFLYLPSLVRKVDGSEALLDLASGLFTSGIPVDFGAVNQTDKSNAQVLTDLPAYAWDKSTSYEIMPRHTHEEMFPGEPFHPLLGRKAASTGNANGQERTYRSLFSLDDIPWIRDHNVSGAVIFPMTGYLGCAIEALRRTVAPAPVEAFVLRDIHVVRSLQIEEERNVDLVTKVKPTPTGTASYSTTSWSFEVQIFHDDANSWATHCYGKIEAETVPLPTESPATKESLSLLQRTASGDLALEEHDPGAVYAADGLQGTLYGPSFRNTTRYRKGEKFTVTDQKLRDLGPEVDLLSKYGSPYTVDPPTLDGFLQGGGSFSEIDWKRLALMPNHVNRLRVSNHIALGESERIEAVTRLLEHDAKGGRMLMSVAAFAVDDNGKREPIVEWEVVTFRALQSGDDEDELPENGLPVNWQFELLARLDLLPKEEQLRRYSPQRISEAELEGGRDLHAAACWFVDQALMETANDDESIIPSHLVKFKKWARRIVDAEGPEIDDPVALVERVKAISAQGELLCAIGEQLVPILRGQVQPLEVMLKDGLLTRHYEADVSNAYFSQLVGELVYDLSNLEPNMRILEIGAGTAGTTLPILQELSKDREEGAFLSYTFTDISSGFFENARNGKLKKWSDLNRITYEKLDISRDPVEQGFTLGEYDLIVAANVLHATANMTVTMTNVRSLLKPRGKVILLEANRHAPITLPFALLPGWWYAEDDYRDRESGPLLALESWNRLLVDTGFTGVDVLYQDHPGKPEQMLSAFMSSRIGKVTEEEEKIAITVAGPLMDDDELDFAQLVADTITDQFGLATTVKPFLEVDAQGEDAYVLVIDSPRHSLLQDVDEDTFNAIKSLAVHNKGMFWIVPEQDKAAPVPEVNIIKGILRTVRLENEPKHVLMMEGIPCSTDRADGIDAILKILKVFADPEVNTLEDQDYLFRDGLIHQRRMRPMKEVKEQFGIEQGVAIRSVQNIWSGDSGLEMTMESAGSPESIYFKRTDVLQAPLGNDEVVVKTEAAGLSYRDLNLVFGSIPWAPPGFDGVGTVVKTGDQVAHLREGDRVFFLSLEGSGLATYKKLPSWHAARVPIGISSVEAATLPLAYTIAVAALIHTARLKKNESVLIHSAAGAVGQAAIVIAQYIGARIFVTAGTEAKREFLHETYGIPKDYIFSSRTPQFRDSILCATGNKGVDVIINSLTGDLLQETWSLIASFGRFVEINKKDAFQNTNLPMKAFERNATFSTIDLRALFQHRPDDLRDIIGEVVNLLQKGVVVPIRPVTEVPVSQFADGLRKLKAGDTTGKIVVTFGKDEKVLAESALRPSPPAKLDPNSTYLITGGTRGIGLALADWMIENAGAKNVVVLGRSGGEGPEVQKVLKKYAESEDVRFRAYACDVGSRESLEGVVAAMREERLPAVKGVVHSALVLNDKLMVNATYEDWKYITSPRIQGAWNLHELLPKLDFFIALSSFLGDGGNPGQSIYAGTASFYDAFSQFRVEQRHHTVSISLPVVLGVGYVADHGMAERLQITLGGTLRMQDIITLVKSAIAQGRDSPFISPEGKTVAYKLHVHGKPLHDIPWKYSHPILLKDRLHSDLTGGDAENQNAANTASTASWTTAADPQVGLTEALITKVSAMTMIARDEVEPDAPLSSHGLDSLVSVELRNWIRRETAVELALTTITQAASLRALATHILATRAVVAK